MTAIPLRGDGNRVIELVHDHVAGQRDHISVEFMDRIEPQLSALTNPELWVLAGMLAHMRNEAEARVAARYAIKAARRGPVAGAPRGGADVIRSTRRIR